MIFDTYCIRPPETDDAAGLFELVSKNRSRLIDYFPISVGSMNDIHTTKVYIKDKMEQAKEKEAFIYILFDNHKARPIGMLFIKSIDWRIPKAELAYYIDKDHEGKGIISKAIQHIVHHSFNTLKINKLFLRVAPDNAGSKRVAEKNGFAVEGTLRKDFKRDDGTLIDLLYYGLLRKK